MSGRGANGGLSIALHDRRDLPLQVRPRKTISDPPDSTPRNTDTLGDPPMRQPTLSNQRDKHFFVHGFLRKTWRQATAIDSGKAWSRTSIQTGRNAPLGFAVRFLPSPIANSQLPIASPLSINLLTGEPGGF